MTAGWTILHAGALGDLVLTLQLAMRLSGTAGARSPLDIISRVDPGDLGDCQPPITRTSNEVCGTHWLFGDCDDPSPRLLVDRIAGRAVLSALGGPHTLAYQRLLELRPARLLGFDPPPHAGIARHITEQWLTQLEGQGVLVPKCIHQRPRERTLGVGAAHRAAGTAALQQAGVDGPTVMIHPGSGGASKCWPADRYVELAACIRSCDIATPVVILGPVELETWPAQRQAALAAVAPVIHMPAPRTLTAILAAAGAYVGNDSGPTHLAALLGTPTFALFGPTPATVWRPLGSAEVLQGDPAHGSDWGIPVQRVAEVVTTAFHVKR
jgi:hypothetical protein